MASIRFRWARRVALASCGLAAGYVALVVHPQPLFAYTAQRENLVLHAREPFPAEVEALMADGLARVRRSPLYEPEREHHVFLCDTAAVFALFTLWNRNAAGVAATWANGNVFIRPASVQRGRVVGPSGQEKGGERTLAYYVAHEVTHALTVDWLGRFRYNRLAAFQREGYADYVAFAGPVNVALGRDELLADSFDMSPERSGHYDRYRLLVGFLLQDEGWSVKRLLAERLEPSDVEARLRAKP